MASDYLRCPICRTALASNPAEGTIRCAGCERTFDAVDGITVFNPNASNHGEYSPEQMDEILSYAQNFGWQKALQDRVEQNQPRVVKLITDTRRGKLLETLRSTKRNRVLDYGAGYGGVSLRLASMFKEVVALDEAIHRVRFLRVIADQERIGNISVVCHNEVERLPFEDGAFDAVVMTGVLEYLPAALPDYPAAEAQVRALAEIRRIVRPGGLLQIETKNALGWQYWTGARDHNGIPFASLLPLGLANAVSKAIRGKPYRIVNHGLPGYTNVLQRAGWRSPRFRWPYPGYQRPDHVIDLAEDRTAMARHLGQMKVGRAKAAAMRALNRAGLLKFLVPYYSITVQRA